ncbi:MAG: DUF1311 domain-containing protein [Bacteroidales bacterium]|nr:DUF1311 domain-containing protein [Bacteroidales bacterium]
MKKKVLLLLMATMVYSIAVISQDAEVKHPIEEKLSKCLDDSITTVGMCNCITEAAVAWDKELNKYYKLLKDELDEPAQLLLREAQRKWITYRDNEIKFIDHYYSEVKVGTMYSMFAEDRKKEIVRKRAEELQQYYEELEY